MKKLHPLKRCCRACRKAERIRSIGGIRFNNLALGFCAKCINTAMKS